MPEYDARKIWTKIRVESQTLAEQRLRETIKDNKTLAPDWHPYYGSFMVNEKGVRFTLTVRDGERDYFKKKKKQVPFDTVALEALRDTIKKYSRELLMAELATDFAKTEDVEVS